LHRRPNRNTRGAHPEPGVTSLESHWAALKKNGGNLVLSQMVNLAIFPKATAKAAQASPLGFKPR